MNEDETAKSLQSLDKRCAAPALQGGRVVPSQRFRRIIIDICYSPEGEIGDVAGREFANCTVFRITASDDSYASTGR